MALNTDNLKAVSHLALNPTAGSPGLLHSYVTTDTAATVEGANYFGGAAKMVDKGDIILAVMATGGTPVNKQYVVTASDNVSTVTVALQTTTAG